MKTKITDSIEKSPCHVHCEYNKQRDFGPVEEPMFIPFEDMLLTGVVPPSVEQKDFNDVGDDPNVIVGRVSNVFQALRVRGAIMSAAESFGTELRSRGVNAAPAASPDPALAAASTPPASGFTSSSSN